MTNQVSDLPNFGDLYLQYFDPATKSFELRRKSRDEGALSIGEAMDLITNLLMRYQLTFIPNKTDKHIILFPFMMIEPKPGDKIRNGITNEIYTVDQIIINPDTGDWNGLVRLDLINGPSIEEGHYMEYENLDRYVRFDHESPPSLPNPVGANIERILKNPPPMLPTVTWAVKKVEPGAFGRPFDSRKEFKPRLRESTKDPYVNGYTVEVWGQALDNIVQFDCWSHDIRTSARLVNWFEQFMKTYSGYIRKCGIPNLFFWQRLQDELLLTWRQAYAIQSTQFYFRTEELTAQYQREILRLNVSLGTNESITNRKFNETRYIASQKVSGCLTSEEYRNLFYRSGEYLFGDLDIRQ